MVMDMDPHQQTSIILVKPFLKSVRVTIDNKNSSEVHLPPQEPHELLPDSCPPIRGLEKGKMCGGVA
jgi:hypothetical protein